MSKSGLDILNQSEIEMQSVIEDLKKRRNDVNIYKIINELKNGAIPINEASKLNQIQYTLDNIERGYNKDSSSNDEATFDYAPEWRRKQLSKLAQKLYELIQYIKEKYYITYKSTNIKLQDRKKKPSKETIRKPKKIIKKCK